MGVQEHFAACAYSRRRNAMQMLCRYVRFLGGDSCFVMLFFAHLLAMGSTVITSVRQICGVCLKAGWPLMVCLEYLELLGVWAVLGRSRLPGVWPTKSIRTQHSYRADPSIAFFDLIDPSLYLLPLQALLPTITSSARSE